MTITPAENHIQITLDEVKAGVLNTSSRETAIEYAEIVAVAKYVDGYQVGDKIFIKSWAIDIVTYDGKKYYFVDLATNGIKAIVK